MELRLPAALALPLLVPVVAGCSGGGGGVTIGGLVDLELRHGGAGSTVTASARWSSGGVTLDERVATIPTGSCTAFSGPATVGGGSPLDAGGALSLSGPAGSLSIPRIGGPALATYSVVTTAVGFYAQGTYTLTAPGGTGVSSFSQGFDTPFDLVLTQPAVVGTASLAVNRAADLALAWSPSGTTDSVFATLVERDATGATTVIAACHLPDAGAGTLPSSVLAALSPSGSPSAVSSTLSLFRERELLFQAPPAIETLAISIAGWQIPASVQ